MLTFSWVMEMSSLIAFFLLSGVDLVEDIPLAALSFHSFFWSSVKVAHFSLSKVIFDDPSTVRTIVQLKQDTTCTT